MSQKLNNCVRAFSVCALSAVASFSMAMAQDTSTKPDNSKMNKMENRTSAVTADNSKNNKSDVKLAAAIRRSIYADKKLSTYAHNVKIIVRNGTVTLTGPVKSDDEKKAVVAKAQEIAGSSTVNDQITVASKSGKSAS